MRAAVEAVAAIAARHGVPPGDVRPVAGGVANAVWFLGNRLVLRAARTGYEPDLAREAVVLPAARAAGVRCPAPVTYDPEGAWMVQERGAGAPLAAAGLAPAARDLAYRELGAELARLHAADLRIDDQDGGQDALGTDPAADPDEVVARLASGGWVGTGDAEWLRAWFARLAGLAAGVSTRPVVVHGDAQPRNVLVDPAGGALTALLDWGDTTRAAPAHDLAKIPPARLPATVAGYAAAAAAGTVPAWAAAALTYQLTWALDRVPTGPRPDDPSWSAPPAARLLGVLALFTASGDRLPEPWPALAPPAR